MLAAVLRTLLALTAAVALAAAPCRNCAVSAAETAPRQHDCCPKPKPPAPCHQQQPDCRWAPADTGLAADAGSSVQPGQAVTTPCTAATPHLNWQASASTVHPLLSPSPPGPAYFVLRI